jgi:hypothetical protein
MYERHANRGRPNITPKRLFRALLPQLPYSTRSMPMQLEQTYMLFGCCVGLTTDDAVWNHSIFIKNHRLHALSCDGAVETSTSLMTTHRLTEVRADKRTGTTRSPVNKTHESSAGSQARFRNSVVPTRCSAT